jgi:hypothetical protein
VSCSSKLGARNFSVVQTSATRHKEQKTYQAVVLRSIEDVPAQWCSAPMVMDEVGYGRRKSRVAAWIGRNVRGSNRIGWQSRESMPETGRLCCVVCGEGERRLLEGNPEQPCWVERQGVSRTALG